METTIQNERCQECPARVVCRCLQITEDVIESAVNNLGIRSIKELKTVTGAGDGCTCCHKELKQIIERLAPTTAVYHQSSSSPEPICSCR